MIHYTRNGQPATCDVQLATGNMQQACIYLLVEIAIEANAGDDALMVDQGKAMPLDIKELEAIKRVFGGCAEIFAMAPIKEKQRFQGP